MNGARTGSGDKTKETIAHDDDAPVTQLTRLRANCPQMRHGLKDGELTEMAGQCSAGAMREDTKRLYSVVLTEKIHTDHQDGTWEREGGREGLSPGGQSKLPSIVGRDGPVQSPARRRRP